MTSRLFAEYIPEVRFESFLKMVFEERELEGWGGSMSLRRVVGWVPETIPAGQSGQLFLDTQDLDHPLSIRVTVEQQQSVAQGGFSTHFEVLEKDFHEQDRLVQFYIESLWREITDKIPQKHLDVISNNLVGVFGCEEVSQILEEILPTRSLNYLMSTRLESARRVRFEKKEGNTFRFDALDAWAHSGQPAQGEIAYVFWPHGFRQYLFSAFFEGVTAENQALLNQPLFLLSSSLRREERTEVDEASMWVEIPLPYPKGAVLRREIIDIAPGGFSFRCSPRDNYFLPGTPISHLRIVGKDKEPYLSSGQIRHVIPAETETGDVYLRVGVQFQISNKAFAKGHMQPRAAARLLDPGFRAAADRPTPAHTHDILQTMQHMMKSGLRLYPRRPIPSEDAFKEDSRVFRHTNQKNQEIVGLLNTSWGTSDRRRATVIVLPPPYGKKKEALGLFAHYLAARFRRQYHDAAIVRFDGINTPGESYKDPKCRYSGKEALHTTPSQGTQDILSILDFVENNTHFLAREVVAISFSFSALCTRKALIKDDKKRISFWLAPMGVTNLDDLMRRVSGGIDYFSLYTAGEDLGEVTVLGTPVDGNRFCRDALESGYVSIDDAVEDISRIDTPTAWFYGEHDAWIDPENVERLMRARKNAFKIRILPTGHLPLNGSEALTVFGVIFEELWSQLSDEPEVDFVPNFPDLREKQEREWQRVPRDGISSKKAYWARYLLGTGKDDMGYDVLQYCEQYRQFIQDQLLLLDIRPGHAVADMGCGTGNILLKYLEQYEGPSQGFPQFALVDIVPEALELVRAKFAGAPRAKSIPPDHLQYYEVDLDIHPALPLKKYLLGEYSSLDQLKGQIPGLTDYSIDLWKREYGHRLHQILRGKILTTGDLTYLQKRFPDAEGQIILEFNRAARVIRELFLQYVAETPVSVRDIGPVSHPRHLQLDLDRPLLHLPFPDEYFDRIVCSLVLPYLKNPLDTLAELSRILKPGGLLVVSSMKPDTDMSKIYSQMIADIQSGRLTGPGYRRETFLTATRRFANDAAYLLQLVEERHFRFFPSEELGDMLQSVGLADDRPIESYGYPPQGFIVRSWK